MTEPRRHIAGQVAMTSRRCSERRYFLRPDKFINHVMLYEVGKASERHGQNVYGAVAMSNHVHIVIGDTTGDRSDFMRDTMSGIARSRNDDLGRDEHFWSSGSYNDTVLLDDDAIERKLLYVWLNPVRAGVVDRAEDWPGFMILPKHWGKEITIKKPPRFYGRESPEEVTFIPKPPPGYGDMPLEDVREHFEKLLRKEENKILAMRVANNQSCSGAKSAEELDPFSSPRTKKSKRRTNPRFATKNAELMASAQDIRRGFLDDYETQRQRWVADQKNIVFPCGTIQLKRCAPIKCREVRDDEPGIFDLSWTPPADKKTAA